MSVLVCESLFPELSHLHRYSLILVDPPWRYQNWSADRMADHGSAENHYPTMSFESILALPVSDLAAPNCVLLLWATAPVSAEGRHAVVAHAWGFRPVAKAFSWRKVYASGKPYCGLGFYTRSGGEDCWLAIRGSCPPARHDVYQEIQAPVTNHSAKPHELYDRVEKLWPDRAPRLELFARGPARVGWETWGNQAAGGLQLPGFPALQASDVASTMTAPAQDKE